ncbi:phosphatase PAP2 family protein [Sphingomonas sp. 1P06PA]|uniref:phosphatase PAP2 family protein n=1 Tax=Sphingomonas sp. 1P06PA TaxID=554121 RepID=UPI0039A73160
MTDPDNPIEQADIALADAVAEARHHPVTRVLGAISELADQPPMIAFAGTVLASGLAMRDRRTVRAGAQMLASHLLATWIKGQIKDRIDRTRPDLYHDHDIYHAAPGDTEDGSWRSFPSGHSAGAVAVARALARTVPETAATAQAIAAGVALVQVPRSTHYLSDVVAGVAIGILAEEIVDRTGEALFPNRTDPS